MKVPFFDYKQYASEHRYTDWINDCLSTGFLIGGPAMSEFERSIENYTGIKHCIAVANATDAMEITFQYLKPPEKIPMHNLRRNLNVALRLHCVDPSG